MKIIFLDIDGVLCLGGNKLVPKLVRRFNRLVKETGARVVLSSSWRLFEEWEIQLKHHGIDCKFLGRTPELENQERGYEVDRFICDLLTEDRNLQLSHYVIIDDDDDFLPAQPRVKIDRRIGLTEEDCEKIKKKLSTVRG